MLKSKSQPHAQVYTLQPWSRLIPVAASASIVGNGGRWVAVAEAVEVDNILLVLLIFDCFVYLCDSSLLNSDFFILFIIAQLLSPGIY